MWDALRLDVRHSFRSLRRAPTFSLIVIVTLTLAVGATAALGSLLNALVFRTLAVPSPALLFSDDAVRRRRPVARRGRRGACRRVRERRDGYRLARLLRHGWRACIV